jgi:large subunit ribosomal protein L18
MSQKNVARLRRALPTRAKIHELRVPRLSVHRTNQHIYAQVLSADGAKVLASASTVEKDIRGQFVNGGNVKAASVIGKRIAEQAQKAGVVQVAFDRGGFKYHGRVKALADAAREAGLKF